jgi:hypothetical protein
MDRRQGAVRHPLRGPLHHDLTSTVPHEISDTPEFKRRIKTQTVLPSAETAAMLFWALLASGQITMRKVDGWQSLGEPLAAPVPVDLAA